MSATMESITAPLTLQFSLNHDLVLQALDGLTHEELWRAPTSRNNALLWVAGHVVQTRAFVAQLLERPIDTGWGSLFDRGAKVEDPSHYPTRDEVERVMGEVSAKLNAALAEATEEQLNRPASMEIPGCRSLADELAFFSLHESYHVGQLAYIRKSLGHPAMVG